MLYRILAGLIGGFNTANGLYMVLRPADWFDNTPGVTATGPFNPHFVTDIGFAYLAGGIAFLAFAWRPRWRLAAFGASGFLGLHALLHLAHAAQGHVIHAGADIAVAVPALAGLALCWPRRDPIDFAAG
jgi:hypothetical protein